MYAELEARAFDCLVQVEAGTGATTEIIRRLGYDVERLLWFVWGDSPSTAGYWQDGVAMETVEPRESATMVLRGKLWCANHREMWLVPAQAVLELDEERRLLRRVLFRCGDGARASLRDNAWRRRFHEPETWLCQIDVERPREDVPDVEPLLAELSVWLDASSGGKIVGPDWEPLTLAEAEALIRTEADRGRLPRLERTWLDGGAAIRVR